MRFAETHVRTGTIRFAEPRAGPLAARFVVAVW
jgi:hypothetical protein